MITISIPDYDIVLTRELFSGNITTSATVSMDELSIDTLTAVTKLVLNYIDFGTQDSDAYTTQDGATLVVEYYSEYLNPRTWAYGTPIYVYDNDTLVDKFYFSEYAQEGEEKFQITAISSIGLLDNITHYGGIYTGQTAYAVIQDIIKNLKLPTDSQITINELFKSINIYGYLPIDTARNNLKQLLFATGGIVRRNTYGNPHITILDSSAIGEITADRVYLSNGSIEYQTLATEVDVTEHSYELSSEVAKTLFYGSCSGTNFTTPDGYDVTNATIITFSNPSYDISVTGTSILNDEVHANYCVVTAGNSVTITGKEYIHNENVIKKFAEKNAYIIGDTPYASDWLSSTEGGNKLLPTYYNIYRIKTTGDYYDKCYRWDGTEYYSFTPNPYTVVCRDVTLVSFANSVNVAERLLAYYGGASLVSQEIVLKGEKSGDYTNYIDTFNQNRSGFIVSLDSTLGYNKIKSNVQITNNFSESDVGNYYDSNLIILEDSTYNITASEDANIRFIVIGGGSGGNGGSAGTTGGSSTNGIGGDGGVGGKKGTGGSGGKVAQTDIEINAEQTISANISIGAGGTGGAGGTEGINDGKGNDGSAGESSIVTIGDTQITSEDGLVFSYGYIDLFTGQIYAGNGTVGVDGANGGNGGDIKLYNGTTGYYYAGTDGDSNELYTGGTGGTGRESLTEQEFTVPVNGTEVTGHAYYCNEYGGGGGGGAGGSNGNNASSPNPGNGANGGSREAKTIPGYGGDGGHGGGGGGGAGGSGKASTVVISDVNTDITYNTVSGGVSGYGGTGGDGAPGCIIIYYNTDTVTITKQS